MDKVDLIVHGKWLITCDEQNQVLKNHSLIIKGSKIHAIIPSKKAHEEYEAKSVLQYTSKVVLPGFINAHTHSAMTVFRGLADDLEVMDWLNNHIWPAEKKWVSEELVYDASLLAMAEMIRCGTICFNDMYFFLGATAKATLEAGMRGNIGMTVINVPTAWAKTPDEYFAKAIEFYQQYKDNEFITPTLAPHSTYTVSIENLIKVKEIADKYRLKINIHLQEAPSEIELSMEKYHKRPLERLNEIGMVNPNLIAIHMTQINDADLDILQKNRPNIVNCPESNMKTVSGASPVAKLLKLGINVALGTDGAASNNDLDMITEMRTAAFLGKMIANDPKALPAETVLKMATLNGAKALGLDHLTGSLQPGKAADFIAMDLDQVETQPLYFPISQIVYAASRNQVTDVWVAGKQLMKDRKLLTLDETELLKKAQAWGSKIKG